MTQQISRKLLRMDVLTSETCWALNNEIIKQVTSSWSLFIQLVSSVFSFFWSLENLRFISWKRSYTGVKELFHILVQKNVQLTFPITIYLSFQLQWPRLPSMKWIKSLLLGKKVFPKMCNRTFYLRNYWPNFDNILRGLSKLITAKLI